MCSIGTVYRQLGRTFGKILHDRHVVELIDELVRAAGGKKH
jgi:hypothetical protein